MTAQTEEVSLTVDESLLESIKPFLEANAHGSLTLLERKNLGGDEAVWIVLATLGVQALPHLVTLLQGLTGRGGTRKYVIGDVAVENPSPRDLDVLHTMLMERAAGDVKP